MGNAGRGNGRRVGSKTNLGEQGGSAWSISTRREECGHRRKGAAEGIKGKRGSWEIKKGAMGRSREGRGGGGPGSSYLWDY